MHQGVVSLLDDEHYSIVEDISSEIESEFGATDVYPISYPHFSYHVVDRYDIQRVENVLREIAREKDIFEVRTSGIGVFTDPEIVVYIPVVRNRELSELHNEIWNKLSKPSMSKGKVEHYSPKEWFPHITLAQGVDKNSLPRVVSLVEERDLKWEIEVDNISVLYDEGEGLKIRSNFRFEEF